MSSLFLTEEEKQRQRDNVVTNRNLLWDSKKQACADCKLRWHPSVMTFDHVDRRTITKNKNAKNINSILYYNPDVFRRQLNAGSFVCKNCHFIREMKRDIDGPMAPKYFASSAKQYFDLCIGALLKASKEM